MAWYDWIRAFGVLGDIQKRITALDAKVSTILTFVDGKRPATNVRLDFGRFQLLDKKGRLIMSGSVNVTTDHDARIPLSWTDDVGTVSAPDAKNTTATSDNPAVATVDVAPDDASIVVRSVADGTCNVTVTNGSLSDSISVTVSDPSATKLEVDAADAVLIAKGTPA